MLPALISAGSSIIGGLLGNQQRNKEAKMQKEFAQHGIRWKVADAKAAGIHPLAALGAQTVSYSPQAVGSDLSSGLASAGQDIARAVNTTRTAGERVDAYTKTVQDLNLQRMGLENQLLSSQIAKINQAGSAPAAPTGSDRYLIEGQGNSPLIKDKALERNAVAPGATSQEAGAVSEVGYLRTPSGFAPVFSKDAKDRLEDDLTGEIAWAVRNRLLPTFGFDQNPPALQNTDGHWYYDPIRQEYRQIKHKGRPRYGFHQWRG